mmetsp:Transcript_56189/g.103028  ORF Transcript_56189/g.103028 Transcript_56189/m.103028 type:complete len:276 (-) Transcript_56189:717-1544(-)
MGDTAKHIHSSFSTRRQVLLGRRLGSSNVRWCIRCRHRRQISLISWSSGRSFSFHFSRFNKCQSWCCLSKRFRSFLQMCADCTDGMLITSFGNVVHQLHNGVSDTGARMSKVCICFSNCVAIPFVCDRGKYFHRCLPDAVVGMLEVRADSSDGCAVPLVSNLQQNFSRRLPNAKVRIPEMPAHDSYRMLIAPLGKCAQQIRACSPRAAVVVLEAATRSAYYIRVAFAHELQKHFHSSLPHGQFNILESGTDVRDREAVALLSNLAQCHQCSFSHA